MKMEGYEMYYSLHDLGHMVGFAVSILYHPTKQHYVAIPILLGSSIVPNLLLYQTSSRGFSTRRLVESFNQKSSSRKIVIYQMSTRRSHGCFDGSPTLSVPYMHRSISQNKDKMEKFLLFRSPFSSHWSLLLENIHLFWVLHLQFIAISQN